MKALFSWIYILIFSVAASADWTTFRGTPALTGVASDPLPEKLDALWTFDTGGTESTPAVAGDTVFITSLDKHLYAIDLKSGKQKWKYQAADEIKSSPSVHNGVVYFGDELGEFHAVDAATGKKQWAFRADAGIISSANFSGDRVLFGSYDNHLYCLSLKDGALAWKLETAGYVHATPAIIGENAIVTGCDGKLRIVRINDGAEQRSIELGAYTAASPAVINGRAYVGTFGNNVLAVDLKQPSIVWKYEDPVKKFPYYSSAAATEQLIAVGGRDKTLHGLEPATGKAKWTYPTKARIDSSPVIAQNRILFANVAGEVIAVNASSGQEVWKFDTGSSIVGSPAVANGKLVIGTKDGTVFCFGDKQKS